MNEKEILLDIINHKGHCDDLSHDNCIEDCPLYEDCGYGDKDDITYTLALSKYIEKYGKDTDLLERMV